MRNPQILGTNLCKTLLILLKRCTSTRSVQQVHSQMILNSVDKPNFLISKLVDDLKDIAYARLVFKHIPHPPDDYAFNLMIRGISSTLHDYPLALRLYVEMRCSGVLPNKFTYPFVFGACGNLSELGPGMSVHCEVFRMGLDGDGHTSHALIMMYAKCREVGLARKVFDEIRERDLVAWNSMIAGYARAGCAGEAVGLFRRMVDEEGLMPVEMTVVSALTACGDMGDIELGQWIERFIMEQGMNLSTYVGSAMVCMYGKCGDLASARRIFDGMKVKDLVTWNAMISGYAQNGMAEDAVVLFNEMKEAGIKPNNITLVGVLSSCASIGSLDLGKRVGAYTSDRGLRNDIYVGTALIDMYAKCGSLDDALDVFEGMPHRNEVSWNAIISALAFHGRAKESLALFKRMMEDRCHVQPNEITFVGVLSACVHAGLLSEGRRLFNMMSTVYGLMPQIEHLSCMVDLYSRAGHLNEAWEIIEKMHGKADEIVLSSLLGACQKHRNADIGEKVLKILLEMEPSNSWNYVVSSKMYAKEKMWDESAQMRLLMREKGITKTPGCSWIEINAHLNEFHAGDQLPSSMIEFFEILVNEMTEEGYIPKTDDSNESRLRGNER